MYDNIRSTPLCTLIKETVHSNKECAVEMALKAKVNQNKVQHKVFKLHVYGSISFDDLSEI